MLVTWPLKDVRTEYRPPGTLVHALALALWKSSSSVQQEPRGSSKSLCYSIWWRSGPHLFPSTHTIKKGREVQYAVPGKSPSSGIRGACPDARWTPQLNSSVIELKLELTPCCSGPHLFRESCRSACHFRGLERLFRGRMKESAAFDPVQSARSASLSGSATSNGFHDSSKIVFDDPCPPSLVPPASSVGKLPQSQTWHTIRGGCTEPLQPRYARNQRAGIRMAPGSAPREETGQGYYASCTGACLHAQKLLGGPPG